MKRSSPPAPKPQVKTTRRERDLKRKVENLEAARTELERLNADFERDLANAHSQIKLSTEGVAATQKARAAADKLATERLSALDHASQQLQERDATIVRQTYALGSLHHQLTLAKTENKNERTRFYGLCDELSRCRRLLATASELLSVRVFARGLRGKIKRELAGKNESGQIG